MVRWTTPEPNARELGNGAEELKTSRYNAKMAALFTERNKYAEDSPARQAAAEAILALWVADG